MAYSDRFSNKSNYGDTQRYNQPVPSLLDMMRSSQNSFQVEGYSSHGSSTSMYGRGYHSQSFNESYHNQYSAKFSPYLGSSTACGEVSRGSPEESAQRSGYQSQKRKEENFDFPPAKKHNQFNSPCERNYQRSDHNQLKQTFLPSYEKIEYGKDQQFYQEGVNPSFLQEYETTEQGNFQHSYQKRVNPSFEQDFQSIRSSNYKETQVTDRFEHTTSDPNNYSNDNFQHQSYSPYEMFHQAGFEATCEGSNGNFGNQSNVSRGNSYLGEYQSQRQRGTENFTDKTHLVDYGLQPRSWFESRGNQMPGPQNNQSFSNTDTKQQVKADLKQEHNPELLQCSEKELISEEHSEDEDEDECNKFDCDKVTEQALKINIVNIDEALHFKYKDYPPTAEEMGSIFEGMVIFFTQEFHIAMADKILLDVVCDSFRKSAQFHGLTIKDGSLGMIKYCTLRYQGMMLSRGMSDRHSKKTRIKGARIWAALELINKLAMTCYTLKINESYSSKKRSEYIMKTRECPGLFRVVSEEEVPDEGSAFKYIEDFFKKEDSDCELVFTNPKMMYPLRSFAMDNQQFDTRILQSQFAEGLKPIAVFKKRTPQYWRDKILASGKMENEKYTLTPPQGLGNELLKRSDIIMTSPFLSYPTADPSDLYDPQKTAKIRGKKPSWQKGYRIKQWKQRHLGIKKR